MTIKQQINHGAIQKVCHLHNDIFHPIHLCHTLSILLYHIPLGYSIKVTNYGMREKTTFRIYGQTLYHIISKEVENCIFKLDRIFRHINNQY